MAAGTAAELARTAAHERCRVIVPAAATAQVEAVLARAGWPGFAPAAPADDGWVAVEGPAAGGAARAAELNAVLQRAGIRVAGIEPVRLALADLIERLVARPADAPRLEVAR